MRKSKLHDTADLQQFGDETSFVAHEEKRFFESFYRANIRGEPRDSMTIGGVTEPESRFHYNATENSIIRALLAVSPPPRPEMVEVWTALRRRRQDRLLDIGSGTGHWIDFMREVFFIGPATALEITEKMTSYLREKYAAREEVVVIQADIADAEFDPAGLNGPFDYVTAIGVMFHIVDENKWNAAIANVARSLKTGGLFVIGDDFGVESRNVQFHRVDDFSTWREFKTAEIVENEIRVNKRVRSIAVTTATAPNTPPPAPQPRPCSELQVHESTAAIGPPTNKACGKTRNNRNAVVSRFRLAVTRGMFI